MSSDCETCSFVRGATCGRLQKCRWCLDEAGDTTEGIAKMSVAQQRATKALNRKRSRGESMTKPGEESRRRFARADTAL